MARIYLLAGVCCIALGAYLGWVLKPSSREPVRAQTEEKQSKVQVVTRTVIKTIKPDGTVVTKEVERHLDKSQKLSKTQPPPKPDYKVGLATGLDLKPTFIAGRRLVGNLWLDSTYKPSTKDITAGLSYEF